MPFFNFAYSRIFNTAFMLFFKIVDNCFFIIFLISKYKKEKDDEYICFYTGSIDEINNTISVIEGNTTLDNYKKHAPKFCVSKNFKNNHCSCEYFLKKKNCEHILCLALRARIIDAPAEAKDIKLGRKRKPGRPSKAKKALVRE